MNTEKTCALLFSKDNPQGLECERLSNIMPKVWAGDEWYNLKQS